MKKFLVAVILLLFALTTLVGCSTRLEPSEKEGRFNFAVTYEVDGERETVSGVFVCKFVKVVNALDGSYIEWDSYIEDTKLENRLDATRGYLLLKTCDDGNIYLDINLSAKYFMGDPSYVDADTFEPITNVNPRLFIEYSQAKGEELEIWWSDDVAVLESYGVKVISYEYDSPIENTYK